MEIPSLSHITVEDVKMIVTKYGYDTDEVAINNFTLHNASHNMLGFLSDYWKLNVYITSVDREDKPLSFFIKAVSRSNTAKARMVREFKLFKKELFFYSVIKEKMEISDLKPWSAHFVTALDEALVFEDLSTLQYQPRNKFERFDTEHTLCALESLARFHASSIILEEKKSKVLGRRYIIQDEFEQFLDSGCYVENDVWFDQCMTGALEAIKSFSKYGTSEYVQKITKKWTCIWKAALGLSSACPKYRNVVCHRDLWNNNILFHYEKVGDKLVPDNCVMVDFQAVRSQPPAGDVMVLLYCNLDPTFREQNMSLFLNHYYNELKTLLRSSNISIDDIVPHSQFLQSAEEHRLWAIIVCACLIPQFWIEEDLTTEIFTDTAQFEDILSKDKGSFIIKMMEINADYKEKVIEIFDEIVERYCLRD